MRIVVGAFPLCGAGLAEAHGSRPKGSTRAGGKGGWRRKQSGRRAVQASWRHEGRHASGRSDQCVGDPLDERDDDVPSFLTIRSHSQPMRPSARLAPLEMIVCIPPPGRPSRRRLLDADVTGLGACSLQQRPAYFSKVGSAGIHAAMPPGRSLSSHLSTLSASGKYDAALHSAIFFHYAHSTLALGAVPR